MNQTIKLDTRKREGKYGEARIAPLRRGERNNALLTVKVCANGQPYDLAGKTASLVATTAAGKLVGPCAIEVAEAGIARIMLPAALYSAVGAFTGYVEIREGETLVDTTDGFGGKVIECADLDSEQAAEFTPLLGELQNAVAEEAKRVEAEKVRARAEAERETGFDEAKQAAQTATEAANDAAAGARSAAGSASDAAESANTAAGKANDAASKAESDVRAFVNAAGTAVGDAIAAAMEDVDAAVKRSDAATAKAETAVKTADAANTAATKAVGDARDAIADVKATEAKLYPAAENILVGSETGAVVHVEDAFAGAALREITVEGACKQDGTPSPDNPVPIQSIENPVVKVTGKNSEPKETRIDLKGNQLCSLTENVQWSPKTYKDELEIDYEGNISLTKRVFSGHIDESKVTFISNTDTFQYFTYMPKTVRPIDGSFAIRSNRFDKVGKDPWNFYVAGGSNAEIFFTFPLGTFANVDELKEWLSNNPIDVNYLGDETQTIPLGKIDMPTLPESTSDIWTDAEVTTNTGIEYVRDVNIVVGNLEKAIASITEG